MPPAAGAVRVRVVTYRHQQAHVAICAQLSENCGEQYLREFGSN